MERIVRIVRIVIVMALIFAITATGLTGCGRKDEKKRREGSKPIIEETEGTKTEKKTKSEKKAEKKTSIGPKHDGELLDIPMGVMEDGESKQLFTVKLPENSYVHISYYNADGKEELLNRPIAPTARQVVDDNIIEKECESFPCDIYVAFGTSKYSFTIESSENMSTTIAESLYDKGKISEYKAFGDDMEHRIGMWKSEEASGLVMDLNDKWTLTVSTDKNVLDPGMSLKEIVEEILEVITFKD